MPGGVGGKLFNFAPGPCFPIPNYSFLTLRHSFALFLHILAPSNDFKIPLDLYRSTLFGKNTGVWDTRPPAPDFPEYRYTLAGLPA